MGSLHTSERGCILEAPLAEVAEEPVGSLGACEVKVAIPVPIEIASGHATAVHQVLVGLGASVRKLVGEEDAGLLGAKQCEAGAAGLGNAQSRFAITFVLCPRQTGRS